jgi:hypothetical protein
MVAAQRSIAVVGDVTVDWMFLDPGGDARGIDYPEIWGAGFQCGAFAQPGGAAMLATLVRELTHSDPSLAGSCDVSGPPLPHRALDSPGYGGFDRMWTSWSLHPRSLADRAHTVWRIGGFWGQSCTCSAARPRRVPQGSAPDFLAVDDANLGYRDDEEAWSRLLSARSLPKAVLMKLKAPLAVGPLWERLVASVADRLTVVVPIDDLRRSSVQVGDPLSWERTAREIVAALRATDLVRAARVVVNLGPTGALLVERDGDCTFVFDPLAQMGDWERQHPGRVLGYATCMSAALLVDRLRGGDDAVDALERALCTMRAVHESGFEEVGPSARRDAAAPRGGHPAHGLRFPYKAAARVLLGDPSPGLARVVLTEPSRSSRSFLVDHLGAADLTAVACAVAVGGPGRLPEGIPVETVGAWSSVDRGEIEGMRAVRNLVAGYATDFESGRRLEQPLSIAVFGPPGAGKSFAVKQIAKTLMPDKLGTCEFNLSQFRSEERLPNAFHEVRDLGLRQVLPLVFWDEFDTPLGGVPLGWLRFFLAPMQDGEFREGDSYHPVGPAVFVFAGGTTASLREFAEIRDPEAEKAAKKPDFLSRLKGYVDVLGPNPSGPDDLAYMLRRALLLRSLLARRSRRLLRGKVLQIDDGVLRAFICVDRFRHGARSMQAIVEMSSLSGKLHFDRSSLPPEDQLDLHVNGRVFSDLVERGP